jgi:CHAD domain
MPANRAPVGLGLAIARWAHRPPSRRRKPAHRAILAPLQRPLTVVALGVGLSAAAAIAVREARRASERGPSEPPETDGPQAKQSKRPRPGRARESALAQLDLAITTLKQAQESDLEQTVHETRKAIKRVRTLELLRKDMVGRKRRRKRRKLLRQAAGELSGARDAQVLLNTLEGLMRRDPRGLPGSPGVSRLHAVLLAEQRSAERALRRSGALERALQPLEAIREEVAAERRKAGRKREARSLRSAVEDIYEEGRSAMRAARRRGGIAEMHQWRKRVKDLRYATEATLEAHGPSTKQGKRLKRIANRADQLGEALGEEHDLALLKQRIKREKALFHGDKRGRRALMRSLRRRRAKLRKRAFTAGASLYDDKPKRFRARLPKAR